MLDARDYLSRIGADRPNGPTLEALQDLHAAHLRAVPFENLDIYRGIPIVLDQERILKKVVSDHRGGFCYELNSAFHWLLTELGFRVTLLSAEVARPEGGFGIPFDHMTLLVEVGGVEWLADVGFGDSFLYPLRFAENDIHEEPDYSYRLSRLDAYALASLAVHFRITQVVDVNQGVHAMIPKEIFARDLRETIRVV